MSQNAKQSKDESITASEDSRPTPDKEFWLSIKANRFAVPEERTPSELLPHLLAMLGSLDGHLRDRVCWEILHTWINEGRYTTDEIQTMTNLLLLNLHTDIGELHGDSAFLRSFSALTLWSISRYDCEAQVWSTEEVHRVFDTSLNYVRDEQDLRGCVGAKGWVDGFGHALILLAQLVQHSEIGTSDFERLLDTLETKLQASTPKYPAFAGSEGFRLGEVVIRVVRRELLPIDNIVAWIKRFDRTVRTSEEDYYGGRWHKVMEFLTSLYVQLQNSELPAEAREKLTPAVLNVLRTYNQSVSVS